MLNFIETFGDPLKGGTGDPQAVVLAGADVLVAGYGSAEPSTLPTAARGGDALAEKLIHSYTQ